MPSPTSRSFALPATVAVVGLGASGLAAAGLALDRGASVLACDEGDPARLEGAITELRGRGARIFVGPDAAQEVPAASCGLAVLSPGVPPDAAIVDAFETAGVPVIAEIELAYRFCPCEVVALTGTNGKTTSTELTTAILEGAGRRVMAAGNIGKPFCDVVRDPSCANLDTVVLELSSFQLETTDSFRPKVAAWLNFAPDHLDRYPSVGEYRQAKLRIFEGQDREQDAAVVRAGEELSGLPDTVIRFTAERGFAGESDFRLRGLREIRFRDEIVADLSGSHLLGRHNAENAMAAMGVAHLLGLGFDEMQAGLRSYTPPAHRFELVATIDGVDFVNDSKATNLHALEAALDALDVRVVLVAGGKDKGLDYRPLRPAIAERVTGLFTIGEIGPALVDLFSADVETARHSPSLDEAVRLASEHAQSGDVVLLSPGTSSFDMFSGYPERGEAFRKAVHQLASHA